MKRFIFLHRPIYLDWAAGAPVHPKAQRAFTHASGEFGNPSAPHGAGRAARALLEDARTRIARLASVKSEQVIFTSGATESNNLAMQGTHRAYKANNPGASAHILYLPTSHASVLETVHALAGDAVVVEPLVITDGAIDLVRLRAQLCPETLLVCVDAVCGETGTKWNVRDVARVLAEVKSPARLHVDASQLPLAGPFELVRLGAHTLTLDAQKVGGVRGAGVLIRAHGVKLAPLQYGGGQEEGLRSGTPAPALASAFAAALEECAKTREKFQARAAAARAVLIHTITTAIQGVVVNEGSEGVPHILNFSFPGRDTDYAVALLDAVGIAVSTRSSCETDSDGSRVVRALTGDEARARATLRFSWGPSTTQRALRRAAKDVIRTITFLDKNKL